jgi:pimeloyl-ACP methyl ester carboxylesterase
MSQEIKKPSLFLHFTEVIRAAYEWMKGLIFLSTIATQKIEKKQTILVVPGLLSTDLSTFVLRRYLQKLGYKVSGWEMGRNLGRFESVGKLTEKVAVMAAQNQQKIILIGWSMGGILIREVSKTRPDLVQQVITIGSPFANVLAPNWAKWVFDLLNKGIVIDQQVLAQLPKSTIVPTTALYSKLDGIVPWQACMETTEDSTHQNIEVSSSHFGMGANPQVMTVVAKCIKP